MPLKIIIIALSVLGSLLYWTISFMVLYHLTRFGVGLQPKRFAAAFLMGSVILFATFVIVLAMLFSNPPLNLW